MFRRWLPVVFLGILAAVAWHTGREGASASSARQAASGEASENGSRGAGGGAADSNSGAAPKAAGVQTSALAALEDDYVRLVQSVVPSVVSITTQGTIRQRVPMILDAYDVLFGPRHRVVEQTQKGLGSGVIVSEQGRILTNHHVIAGMQEIRVQFTDGRIEPAKLVGSDPATDIAVLEIKGPVPALAFADSDRVRVGQPVFAIGNPFGLQETVTQGIISAKGRAVRDSGVEFLQTDAAVNQGNSGGPLLNVKGEVIGINSAIYSANTGTWLGISFAIPANVARNSMESILKTGRVQRQTLGVSTMALTPQLARETGLRAVVGALVSQVQPGSPAERAGIQPGDVIVRLNGEILESPAALQRALAGHKAGAKIQLNVVRDGREYSTVVEVANLPEV